MTLDFAGIKGMGQRLEALDCPPECYVLFWVLFHSKDHLTVIKADWLFKCSIKKNLEFLHLLQQCSRQHKNTFSESHWRLQGYCKVTAKWEITKPDQRFAKLHHLKVLWRRKNRPVNQPHHGWSLLCKVQQSTSRGFWDTDRPANCYH